MQARADAPQPWVDTGETRTPHRLGRERLDRPHVSVSIELSERVLAHGAHVAKHIARSPRPIVQPIYQATLVNEFASRPSRIHRRDLPKVNRARCDCCIQ
jgi:hypothetical protein